MIDRQALEVVANEHLQKMEASSGTSLILHLVNGESYVVRNFAQFLDTYCIAAVYPAKALSADSLRDAIPDDDKNDLVFDRIMVPYPAIAYVTLTAREPERKSTIGFHD